MSAICDTGPLVAYLNRRDRHHAWAVALMKQLRPPLLTCACDQCMQALVINVEQTTSNAASRDASAAECKAISETPH